jgi:hypothetical protein
MTRPKGRENNTVQNYYRKVLDRSVLLLVEGKTVEAERLLNNVAKVLQLVGTELPEFRGR